jgi:hypothetical protein
MSMQAFAAGRFHTLTQLLQSVLVPQHATSVNEALSVDRNIERSLQHRF